MSAPCHTIEHAKVYGPLETDSGVVHAVAGGFAAVYSRRCPSKTSPNEDGAAVIPAGPRRGVLAVADGLGGQPGGELASRLALKALRDAIEGADDEAHAGMRSAVLDGFEAANRAVSALGIGAATTLAAVEIEGDRVRPYHVGDSMIVIAGQRGRTKWQTISHSPVGYAVESGLLGAAEALLHEDRHLVSNMVGTPEMRIEVGPSLRLCPRDTLVLATDGLFDNLRLEEVIQIVRKGPVQQAARSLADKCRQRMEGLRPGQPSKPDDLTFILYRMQ